MARARIVLIAFCLHAALGAEAGAQTAAPCPAAPEPPAGDAEPADFRARIETSRKAYEAFACQARLDAAQRRAARQRRAGPTGKIEEFVGDETLQRGDAIVTDKGIRIFRGSRDPPKAADFAPLGAGDRATARRRTLDELERASRQRN